MSEYICSCKPLMNECPNKNSLKNAMNTTANKYIPPKIPNYAQINVRPYSVNIMFISLSKYLPVYET